MRNLTCLLATFSLTILFLTGHVQSASRCYNCAGADCQASEEVCRNSLSFCQKIITSTAGVSVYVKSCADSCVDGNSQTFGPTTISYKCCTTDLCNSSLTNFKTNKWIALVLALVSMLFGKLAKN